MTATEMKHLTMEELEAGLGNVAQCPKDHGELKLIVRRPRDGEREVLREGRLDLAVGLVGDNWKTRGSSKTPDGSAHPEKQVTITNARMIALVAGERERWQLSGDQLFVDLDLGASNLPPGARLTIGSAILEITPPPHNGCKKFATRFGENAVKFMGLPGKKEMHLRGVNARVVQSGAIRAGDVVRKTQAGENFGAADL
jgi:MOSC domain-containing protein YiiM